MEMRSALRRHPILAATSLLAGICAHARAQGRSGSWLRGLATGNAIIKLPAICADGTDKNSITFLSC